MQIKHSFLKGLNRDVSKDKFPSDAYYYLLNGRILTDDGATMSDIINLKSNTAANIDDNGHDRSTYTIIGYTTIQNDIVLFYAWNTATGVDNYALKSVIDVLEYQGNNAYLRIEIWEGIGMNFRVDKKIRAIARYESSDIKKIYWTDNNENIRHANIAENISGLDPSEFDLIGDFFDTPQIYFDNYTSGSIKQGLIYYAYRYIKINGYKTVFSQLSLPIVIGKNITYGNSLRDTKGDDVYNVDNAFNTGIGTKLHLDINNNDYINYYDYIEIVSLWHSAKESIPDITIINRIELIAGNTVYNFIDEGTSNYGTIEYSDFLGQQGDFTAKDLVAKDNRLFTANITEKYFDLDTELIAGGGSYWDSRVYRFGSNQFAELLDNTYSVEYTIYGISPDYVSVSQTADCINEYNKITETVSDEIGTLGFAQKYQSDGTTLGGSGLNVEYNFNIGNYYIGSISGTLPAIDGTIENDYQLGLLRGFQRDEVYRFGVVFFDSKGRQSFVKWIGDIRIPNMSDTGAVTSFNTGDSRIMAKPVFVQVDILTPPVINGEVLDWQIVYVKRENVDKSIVFAGMFSAGVNYGSDTRAAMIIANIDVYTINAGSTYNKNNILVMSPDIVFKKTEYLNIDFLHTVGNLADQWPIYKDRSGNWFTWISGGGYSSTNTYINIRRFPVLAPIPTVGRTSINGEAKAIPPNALDFTVPVGVDTYKHVTALDSDPRSAPHGTAMVYRIIDVLPAGASIEYYYGYGRKIVYDSQYGGQTYENRSVNTYISASEKETNSVSNSICTRGDSFIGLFEYLRLIQIPELFGKGQSEWMQFICESSINVIFRHDDQYSSSFFLDNIIPTYINENVYIDTDTGLSFSALYQYNFVYSGISEDKKFFSLPLNFVNREEHITRINYSDVKIDTEDHDGWLSFRANNYNEANQSYGAINRIVNFYDKIFSFQDNALSLVSINPRVTQVSEDGITISLGTGSVIDDFNYLTTDIGCQDNSDIIKSFSTMYWLDKNKKKIYSYDGKIQSVTDLKGMHSYLKNNILEESFFTGTYDMHNSEVIMTIYDNIAPNSEFQAIWYAPLSMWDLTGDTTLLDYNFIENNVYKIKGGWFRLHAMNNYTLRLEYSHGIDLIADEFIDMHVFMSERDNFTIAYNEKVQAFTSFYSFIPDLYISHNRDFFTSINNRDLWQHNIGANFNEFYGIAYPLQLKLISNYGTEAQGEYLNFKYFMTVKDTLGDYQRNETFTNIHAKNEYQKSTDIVLYPMHLPNDADRTKDILDTSSIKIGVDWYTGLSTPDEGLSVYNNELYRNTSGGALGTTPGGAGWSIAELANIRKTVEHWLGQMPRYDHRDAVYDSVYLTSDRLRSNWLEITFEFRSVLPTVNIEERELKISDIILSNNPLQF